MKYANIISDFTWSYSRISQFESCPYGFFLKYILHLPERGQFFAQYGSFCHKLIELYLLGLLEKEDIQSHYLTQFKQSVSAMPPSAEVFKSYFRQGLRYFGEIDFPYAAVHAVERKVDFFIDGVPFTGFIDAIAERDGGLVVLDHKSRTLKPRSTRKKPTKADEELDRYLRQHYLYSEAVKSEFGEQPRYLDINCYRSGELISEPFREEKLRETKDWALRKVEEITENENWRPDIEFWKCRYLCGQCDNCEYFQASKG